MNTTSQVLDEIIQLHLAFCFDVGAVHVCVEEDDGEGQDEDGVWVLKLPHQCWITYAVPLTTRSKNTGRLSQCITIFLNNDNLSFILGEQGHCSVIAFQYASLCHISF